MIAIIFAIFTFYGAIILLCAVFSAMQWVLDGIDELFGGKKRPEPAPVLIQNSRASVDVDRVVRDPGPAIAKSVEPSVAHRDKQVDEASQKAMNQALAKAAREFLRQQSTQHVSLYHYTCSSPDINGEEKA